MRLRPSGRSAPCIAFDPSGGQTSLQARVNGHDDPRPTLDALSAQSGRRMAGILGHQIFARCVVQVDYAQHCVSLFDAAGYEYAGSGAAVPIELIEHHPSVTASVVLPGGRSIKGRFVIDTGASSHLILSADQVESAGVDAAMGKTLAVQGHGVGGGSEMRLARIDRLELGGYSLARPIAVLRPAGAGRVSAPGTLGNIGRGILSRFKVIFDHARRRMLLEPGPDIAQPFESDMSGLTIVSAPPDYRMVRVARVQAGSPALDAGVQTGDEIESVDGSPAGEIGVPALRGRFRREGQEIRLRLRRGAERLAVTLRTRRMI